MISRNDPCWFGSQQKWKKSQEPIQKISIACQVSVKILDALCKAAVTGVTTQFLDDLCREFHDKEEATPAHLGYRNLSIPKTICNSRNEVICHGISDQRPLQEGDILNIDVSCTLHGFFRDTSRMVMIGNVSPEKEHVVNVSYEFLQRAIQVCKRGAPIWHIGEAVEDLATSQNCSVVNQFVDHGLGLEFHEFPEISHQYNDCEIPMTPGMTFTIELMINIGVCDAVIDLKDHWTDRTKDGYPPAQWEHAIMNTKNGHRLITI